MLPWHVAENCVSVDNGIEVNNAPEGKIVMVVIHVYYYFFLHSFSRQEILHRTVSALLRAPILSWSDQPGIFPIAQKIETEDALCIIHNWTENKQCKLFTGFCSNRSKFFSLNFFSFRWLSMGRTFIKKKTELKYLTKGLRWFACLNLARFVIS